MFVSIEGIEGTGKSTVAKALVEKLTNVNVKVELSREPGGTVIAECIRRVLLEPFSNEVMQPKVELMLMFASRLQHVEAKIKPALKRGEWVICDRFVDASYAYQGAGRSIDLQEIAKLHNWTIANFMPDKTILLDMDPSKAFERVHERNNGKDRIELEAISFFEKVRNEYLLRAKKEPNRFVVVNADQTHPVIMQEIWEYVQQWRS